MLRKVSGALLPLLGGIQDCPQENAYKEKKNGGVAYVFKHW